MDPGAYLNFLRDQISAVSGSLATLASTALAKANNLSDVANVVTALSNLGGMPLGDSGWTNVSSFSNSWTASAAPPGYMLVGRMTCMRGALLAGTANQPAFFLPAAYRPSNDMNFDVNNGAASLNVVSISHATGAVTPLNSATVWLTMITFPIV